VRVNFEKSHRSRVILKFGVKTSQLVQIYKPIRHLFCTFSSCSDLGIYLSYNIYNFQENQRTKNRSLHSLTFHSLSLHFTSLTTSWVGGRQRGRMIVGLGSMTFKNTARARLGHFIKEIPLKIIRNKKKSIMKFCLKNTLEDRHCEVQF